MNMLTYDADSPNRPKSKIGEPTWEMTLFFPRQGAWTEEDYLSLGTNWMIEFSDGCLEVLPMPTILHQLIVEFLHSQLKAFLESRRIPGRVLFAPLPIRLRSGKFREPDIVYLNPRQLQNVTGQPEGADFIIEVVSDGADNRRRDLETKPREYAAANISEYWIVDPQEQQITILVLGNDKEYQQYTSVSRGEVAASLFFSGFSIRVDEVFDVGESIGNES